MSKFSGALRWQPVKACFQGKLLECPGCCRCPVEGTRSSNCSYFVIDQHWTQLRWIIMLLSSVQLLYTWNLCCFITDELCNIDTADQECFWKSLREISVELLQFCQGNLSTAVYAVKICTLGAKSGLSLHVKMNHLLCLNSLHWLSRMLI